MWYVRNKVKTVKRCVQRIILIESRPHRMRKARPTPWGYTCEGGTFEVARLWESFLMSPFVLSFVWLNPSNHFREFQQTIIGQNMSLHPIDKRLSEVYLLVCGRDARASLRVTRAYSEDTSGATWRRARADLSGGASSRRHQARAGGLASTSQRSAAAPPARSATPKPGQREITNDGGSGERHALLQSYIHR